MRKALIICDVFPPAFAPRMGYLARYIEELSWMADIITSDHRGYGNYESLVGDHKIVRVNLLPDDLPPYLFGRIKRMLMAKNRFFSNKKPYIKAAMKMNQKYDIILVSNSWSMYVLEAGLEVAKQLGIPLVVDLRDIQEQRPVKEQTYKGIKEIVIEYFNNSFAKSLLKLRNEVLPLASAVTTVSPWHAEQLTKYNKNTFCIYNGYDPDTFYPVQQIKINQFKIIYTGSINSIELRDPTLLFEATAKLKKKGIIQPETFRIQFYSPKNDEDRINGMKSYHDIKEFVDFFRYIETSEVPNLLSTASIALLLTNLTNSDGPKGVISTTRFFEYIAVERPILCVRSDESLMEEGIKEANAGVSARTANEAYDFILEKWLEWKEKGYTTVKVNQEYKKQFSRKLQAGQFVEIFEKVIAKENTK